MKAVSASEDGLLPTSALQMTFLYCKTGRRTAVLVECLDTNTTRYEIEIAPDKTKMNIVLDYLAKVGFLFVVSYLLSPKYFVFLHLSYIPFCR